MFSVQYSMTSTARRRDCPGVGLVLKVSVALVGVLGRAEAGELAHGPELFPVHRRVDTAGIGRKAGIPLLLREMPLGETGGVVKGLERDAADGLGLARRPP